MAIRSSAKALIIHNGEILLNKCKDSTFGEYYALPGGGQHQYETLNEAVIRECLEETGHTVSIIRYAAFCEEIIDNADLRERYPDYTHKQYHIFLCSLADVERHIPTELDDHQSGSVWVKLEEAPLLSLFPLPVRESFLKIIEGSAPLFFGSAHISR